MTSPIARPTFYEGEILPAADLVASVDYARNQMARHARNHHSWGIVTGLSLTGSSSPVLSAGVAIDGTGRELVQTSQIPLDPSTFNVAISDSTTWYPVFISGVDQAAPVSSSLTGACGSSQSTSTQETVSITFGSPGSELQIADQTAPAISDPPDNSAWLILVGWVQWDLTNSKFLAAQSTTPTGVPVPVRYAGVNAAEVTSPNQTSLLLATGPASPQGLNPAMAIQIDAAPTPQFVFGKLGANGSVIPALTVYANGNVTATGQITGTGSPGNLLVQSGIAFDGMTLPLPFGVDPATATLHYQVTVHYESITPGGAIIPSQCWVDPSTLQVHCKVIQFSTMTIAPGWCDYLVIAAVPASGSGS